MAIVVLLGTCDTKLEQLLFLREQIQQADGVQVTLVDVGRTNVAHNAISITQETLLSRYGNSKDVSQFPRGDLIKFMSSCASQLVRELHDTGKMHAIIAAGGSGGTSLAAPIMREVLPIGFPKMIISTVASGDVAPIIGETDITITYSVVDIAGMNEVLQDVLSNAGAAVAATAMSYAKRREAAQNSSHNAVLGKQRVGITMFGVTTPGVEAIKNYLESNYDIETYIFHATGHGGKAMERLIREGRLHAVLDLTTTELCDLITGGIMSAGDSRLEAAAAAGIPNIISLGATDMTNFGPLSTVPEKYKERQLYEHNPVVTLMRSSEDECIKIGKYICVKLRAAKDPKMVQVWIPRGGVSMIAKKGGPFEDGKADDALLRSIHEGLQGSGIDVVDDERDVNDPGFAHDIAEALVKKMGLTRLKMTQDKAVFHNNEHLK
jgi:uncharacterized protein (UPF0261 family)